MSKEVRLKKSLKEATNKYDKRIKDMEDKNLCGKTRDVNNPYEVWVNVCQECRSIHCLEHLDKNSSHYSPLGRIEYRVLKKYQKPSLEKSNPYARWFVAAKSEATFGTWEYGDNYIKDITSFCTKVEPSIV